MKPNSPISIAISVILCVVLSFFFSNSVVAQADDEFDRSKRGKSLSSLTDFKNELWLKDYHLAQETLQKGLTEFQENNFDEAEKHFTDAQGILPEYPAPTLYLGLCRYRLKDYEAALQKITQAIEKYEKWKVDLQKIRDDDLNRIQDRLDHMRFWRQKVVGDLSSYEQDDLTDTPSYKNARNQLAHIDAETTRLESLKKELTGNEKEGIPAEYFFHAGNCLLYLERYEEAYAQYVKAIEKNEKYGQAYHNLALILFLAKEYQEAWIYLQAAKENGAQVNTEFEKKLNDALAANVK